MNDAPAPSTRYAADGIERISMLGLMGVKELPRALGPRIIAGQLREVHRFLALRLALPLLSIPIAGFLLTDVAPIWLIAIWTLTALSALAWPLLRQRTIEQAGYSGLARIDVLQHARTSLAQGAVWAFPLLAVGADAAPATVIGLWTIASCMMAAVVLNYRVMPLSAISYASCVGLCAIWLIYFQAGLLVSGIIACYTAMLIVLSLRQARLFGIHTITTNELAENREVVSLLLKEHDYSGASWLWQTDAARRLCNVSPLFARLLDTTPEAIEGRSVLEVLAGPDWAAGHCHPALHLLAEALKARTPLTDLALPVMVGQRKLWWQISATPRTDGSGAYLGFRGVGSDITAQKEAAERIAQLAHFDTLTKLPNRLSVTEQLAITIDNVGRMETRCAFLMIDLDRFKAVNDTLGHLVGDQLLAQVAGRLAGVSTRNEICGRLGGDEFAVVIRDVPDIHYVERLALSIIEAVSQPYQVDGHTLHIGASIGSATAPMDGCAAETLMRNADLAMYQAKEDRGRHFSYVRSMHADAEERRELEIALREALGKDEFHLVYQPIVGARSGELNGFEALLRWTHPQLGKVSPEKFIPVAEEAHLIGEIGAWVLRTACEEARHWPPQIHLAVNISPEQLCDPLFQEMVGQALEQSGLAPESLELEVTERIFLKDGSDAARQLEKLSRMGVRLSLDDFGTGYSSLGYLSRARFNTIKIDRAFVVGAARNQAESLAIVRAVIAMADGLEMVSTAEGVETEMEYLLLRQLGCTQIQGFYFGRPMTATKARSLFTVDQRRNAVA